MNAWTAAASIMILVSGAIATSQAQQPSTTLSPAALKEIAEVEAEIDRIEGRNVDAKCMSSEHFGQLAWQFKASYPGFPG